MFPLDSVPLTLREQTDRDKWTVQKLGPKYQAVFVYKSPSVVADSMALWVTTQYMHITHIVFWSTALGVLLILYTALNSPSLIFAS